MRGIGANTVQIFEAMLLGSWLSEKDGRKLGGVSAHIDQKDLLEVGKIVPAFDVAQHHSPCVNRNWWLLLIYNFNGAETRYR